MENITIRAVVNHPAVDLQPGLPLRDVSGKLIDERETDKRLGVPVREAVFALPQGTTIMIQDVREGILEILVPPDVAQEVAARLRSLTALNDRKMWIVMYNVGPDAIGDEHAHHANREPPVHGEGHKVAA